MEVLQGLDPMQGLEYIATQFNSNIPSKGFQSLGFPQRQKKKSIQKLAAGDIVVEMTICALALGSSTQRLKYNLSQVLGIIVIARNKGMQPARKSIDRQIVWILVRIWKNDAEAAIQLFCSDISEVFRYEAEGNEVGCVGLADPMSVARAQSVRSAGKRLQRSLTYLNISVCVSAGRSRIVFFLFEPCARLGPGIADAGEESSLAMVSFWFLNEHNGSIPMIWKVRFQTSSASGFVRGVGYLRRDDLLGRAGIMAIQPRRWCLESRVGVCRSARTWG